MNKALTPKKSTAQYTLMYLNNIFRMTNVVWCHYSSMLIFLAVMHPTSSPCPSWIGSAGSVGGWRYCFLVSKTCALLSMPSLAADPKGQSGIWSRFHKAEVSGNADSTNSHWQRASPCLVYLSHCNKQGFNQFFHRELNSYRKKWSFQNN